MAAIPVVDIPDPSQLTDSQLLRHIFASVTRMESTLTAQQKKIETLEGEVSTLNKKVFQLKNLLNLREQECRGLSIRVSGLPFTEEEKAATDGRFLSKKVFERILQPLLVQAKASNYIDKVPGLTTTITECYRLRSGSALTATARPPPVIVKVASEFIKLGILRTKRQHMPKPNPVERDMGIVGFHISKDLTPATYNMMKNLRREELVSKVWSINGRIKYTRAGDPTVHSVNSVFDSVETILSKSSK